MELTRKQAYWKAHIEAADEFAGSLVDYARLHDLEVKQLYVYKTSLREKAALAESVGFVQVTTSQSMSMNTGIQVMLPNGVRLSLPDVNTPGLLERLARL